MSFPHLLETPPLPRVAELQNLEIWFASGVVGLGLLFWTALAMTRRWRKKRAKDGVFRKYHLPEDESF
ncbi:hypothetical protein [Neomegalonema perideroedes]|uniref:hypothetical protein n=1 Tax=Neomegalonema perideroedes TaxID=217219 RepID=UPI0012FDEAD2|nr:hypothetical protein [Neomegalonema perideroedes]